MKPSGISSTTRPESKPVQARGQEVSDNTSPGDTKAWKQCLKSKPPHSGQERSDGTTSKADPAPGSMHMSGAIMVQVNGDQTGSNGKEQEGTCDAAQNITDLMAITDASGELDPGLMPLVENLAANCQQHQLFEVIMPNSQVIGVLVQAETQRINITLTPHDRRFAKVVKKQDRALESELKKRLGKDVDLSVVS